jgi:hypothetical protein
MTSVNFAAALFGAACLTPIFDFIFGPAEE